MGSSQRKLWACVCFRGILELCPARWVRLYLAKEVPAQILLWAAPGQRGAGVTGPSWAGCLSCKRGHHCQGPHAHLVSCLFWLSVMTFDLKKLLQDRHFFFFEFCPRDRRIYISSLSLASFPQNLLFRFQNASLPHPTTEHWTPDWTLRRLTHNQVMSLVGPFSRIWNCNRDKIRLHLELWRRKDLKDMASRGSALEEDLDSKTKHEYGKNMIFSYFSKVQWQPKKFSGNGRRFASIWISGENLPQEKANPPCTLGCHDFIQALPQLLNYSPINCRGALTGPPGCLSVPTASAEMLATHRNIRETRWNRYTKHLLKVLTMLIRASALQFHVWYLSKENISEKVPKYCLTHYLDVPMLLNRNCPTTGNEMHFDKASKKESV